MSITGRRIQTRTRRLDRSAPVPGSLQRERDALAAKLRPSAREMHILLMPLVIAARPEIGIARGAYRRDKSGRKRYLNSPTVIYGRSTFRNRLDPDGQIR